MDIKTLNLIYFSPTRSTKKVVETIAQGITTDHVRHIDLTLDSSSPEAELKIPATELSVIGIPVYSGRIPNAALNRLKKIRSYGSPAIIVVVYGNISFEDSLLELQNVTSDAGFRPVSAAAFIAEHSFSTAEKPIAKDRPDKDDMNKAVSFGRNAYEKIRSAHNWNEISGIAVPGKYPYKEKTIKPPVSPETLEEKCQGCGTCVGICPVHVIDQGDTITTDKAGCILCHSCIKNCPAGARVMDNPFVEAVVERLFTLGKTYKEPEIFL